MEEAAELVQAGKIRRIEARRNLIHEAADLLYHLFVMLIPSVPLTDVEAELARRFGISGLDEKASRQ